MKILVLGGSGMLGHQLVRELAPSFETVFTLRGEARALMPAVPRARAVDGPDALDLGWLERLLDAERPDAVLNAVGVIKQVLDDRARAQVIAVNALFPHQLQELCRGRGIRLVHYSTDCVFSGSAEGQRGPLGYRETDPTDPQDLYGLSKRLGEPSGDNCLVLRTSIIGPELRGGHSLLEWFLAQTGSVRGFTGALYSGLTTPELARLTGTLLRTAPDIHGLWHVAADPISKHDLLRMIGEIYGSPTTVIPDDHFRCDRRLDGSRFAEATGWRAPPWREMVTAMRDVGR